MRAVTFSTSTTPRTVVGTQSASTALNSGCLGPRYAFLKEIDGWHWVVIVGKVMDGRGEVLEANRFRTEAEADAWRVEMIGDGPAVYRAPEEQQR